VSKGKVSPERLKSLQDLGRVLYPDLYRRRRASPELRHVWALMASKQNPPEVVATEGFTDSIPPERKTNGCKTDGA
jgi:hypothetical protein